MNLKKLIINFLRDDRGQSTTEYILILSVVVMIAMKFRTTFRDKLGTVLNSLSADLDKATQSEP